MKETLIVLALGAILAGTAILYYRDLKRQALDASQKIKADKQAKAERDKQRWMWEMDHQVLPATVDYGHIPVVIGGYELKCPQCYIDISGM